MVIHLLLFGMLNTWNTWYRAPDPVAAITKQLTHNSEKTWVFGRMVPTLGDDCVSGSTFTFVKAGRRLIKRHCIDKKTHATTHTWRVSITPKGDSILTIDRQRYQLSLYPDPKVKTRQYLRLRLPGTMVPPTPTIDSIFTYQPY